MFYSERAKQLGHTVRQHVGSFIPRLADAFAKSIIGEANEVRFFDNLLSEIPLALHQLQTHALDVRVRVARTHQKPRVDVPGPNGFSCELADLLVVVKYDLGGGMIERKSLFYQVKLCDRGTTVCSIDQNQLTLLTAWPAFSFGRKSNGGPITYQVEPRTLEFGSYMLMLRAPDRPILPSWWCYPWSHSCYGVSPYARQVHSAGPLRVDIRGAIPYSQCAAEVFFRHLGFELGEHHDANAGAAALVSAIYRHLKLDPDPPNEFEGFTKQVHPEENPGFALVEITVGPGKQFEWPA